MSDNTRLDELEQHLLRHVRLLQRGEVLLVALLPLHLLAKVRVLQVHLKHTTQHPHVRAGGAGGGGGGRMTRRRESARARGARTNGRKGREGGAGGTRRRETTTRRRRRRALAASRSRARRLWFGGGRSGGRARGRRHVVMSSSLPTATPGGCARSPPGRSLAGRCRGARRGTSGRTCCASRAGAPATATTRHRIQDRRRPTDRPTRARAATTTTTERATRESAGRIRSAAAAFDSRPPRARAAGGGRERDAAIVRAARGLTRVCVSLSRVARSDCRAEATKNGARDNTQHTHTHTRALRRAVVSRRATTRRAGGCERAPR